MSFLLTVESLDPPLLPSFVCIVAQSTGLPGPVRLYSILEDQF